MSGVLSTTDRPVRHKTPREAFKWDSQEMRDPRTRDLYLRRNDDVGFVLPGQPLFSVNFTTSYVSVFRILSLYLILSQILNTLDLRTN